MTIASGRQDFNGFHLVNLDGSELRQVSGGPEQKLRAVRQVAIAPDGARLVLSREFNGFPQARFGLIQGQSSKPGATDDQDADLGPFLSVTGMVI